MQYKYTKTAEEFVHLYEKTRRLQHPMDLVGEIWDEVHMNHYRFYAGNHYMDCYASTQNSMIEFGLDRVSEKLPYSERNFTLALDLCHNLTDGYFAAKVLCYPDYDKGTICFDVWFQSIVPQTPDDMDYMVEGVTILAGIVREKVDCMVELFDPAQRNKPNTEKHYD